MDSEEKKGYEVSSQDPPHYGHPADAVDMRGRHGRDSIVKGEAAEIYGDIQTAERKSTLTIHCFKEQRVAKAAQITAMSHVASNPDTFNSSHSAVPSALVSSWVSDLRS